MALQTGSEQKLISFLMKMMAKQGFGLNTPIGKKLMIFLPAARSAGPGIWKVCASFAKPVKGKLLAVKDTENEISILIIKF